MIIAQYFLDSALVPNGRQAIIWTNDDGIYLSEYVNKLHNLVQPLLM